MWGYGAWKAKTAAAQTPAASAAGAGTRSVNGVAPSVAQPGATGVASAAKWTLFVAAFMGFAQALFSLHTLHDVLLAMLPLAITTFTSDHDGIRQALHRTINSHPDMKADVPDDDELTLSDVRDIAAHTPEHRLDGALLPENTWAHWGFALLSAAFFLGTAIFVMPARGAKLSTVFLTGLFTGTVGIFLLLAVQFIAAFTQHWIMFRGNVFFMLIFWVLKFIGFSYRCAMDPSVGFLGSFFGFTLGVGLCEELSKAIPVLWRANRGELLDWRTGCLCGFLSGVGFGVSEAISYAADYYNGIHGGEIYLVRFISCVALHGVWSAAAGITIFRHQGKLESEQNWLSYLFLAAALVAAPMVLHGMYDTLLKKDMHIAALGVAVASFAYLAYQVEFTHRKEARVMAAMG
jgi:RsiW-degrading membrane proteinase PrsW (M82 family)